MPLLILIVIAGCCLPVEWPDFLNLGFSASAQLTALWMITSLLLAGALSRTTVQMLKRADASRAAILSRYSLARRLLFAFNITMMLVMTSMLGWGQGVWTTFVVTVEGRTILAPFAELLVPGPYLILMVLSWGIYFPVEQALAPAPSADAPRRTLRDYLLFQGRMFTLMVLLPVSLIVTQQSITRLYPQAQENPAFQLSGLLAVILFLIIIPRLLIPFLGLVPLPESLGRSRMLTLASQYNVRITDILLWPTRDSVSNAMIVGVLAKFRYVIFTDRILKELSEDELDAVLGHELGHARHGHLPYYALFLVVSSLAVIGLSTIILQQLLPVWESAWFERFLPIPPLLIMGAFLFVVFGYLSRVCEREADIAGSRAVSPQPGQALTDGSVLAMIHALERVVVLADQTPRSGASWMSKTLSHLMAWARAWQHGPARSRIEFLYRLQCDPGLAVRHHRFAFRLRVVMIALMMMLVILVGSWIGWAELLRKL